MSLKKFLREALLREIFRDEERRFRDAKTKRFSWSVLVVDRVTMRLLRAAFDTRYDLCRENVARVDSIEDDLRRPIDLHAIYFLDPVRSVCPGSRPVSIYYVRIVFFAGSGRLPSFPKPFARFRKWPFAFIAISIRFVARHF